MIDQDCPNVYAEFSPDRSLGYGRMPDIPDATTLGDSQCATVLLSRLFRAAGLDLANAGTSNWNPFGQLIPPDAKVVIKPNWVLHRNHSGLGLDCLVTHTSILKAILLFLRKAAPKCVIIGDAPVQGCNFPDLQRSVGIEDLLAEFAGDFSELRIEDFRLVTLANNAIGQHKATTTRDQSQNVLFDLGAASNLEPVSQNAQFRVTMYDPAAISRTHSAGRHQYLVAKEVMEADVVINVPKLKTHSKAGVTGALKNVVGINGFKEYLPHHRKGGSASGGDCYEGGSMAKHALEHLFDWTNGLHNRIAYALAGRVSAVAAKTYQTVTGDRNLEGAWFGNDTVWRMCLDLQQILHYGDLSGSLQSRPQRNVITITDAIVAGEKNGPLAPSPLPLGAMTFGRNTAALEWVHCLLMGMQPEKIPLVRNAFELGTHRLATFRPEEIIPIVNGVPLRFEELTEQYARPFQLPTGWLGSCESKM